MTETNQIIDNKFYLGEKEFTNIMWVMIRAYRFHNRNQDPEAIVMPEVKEVNGVKIEYPEVNQISTKTKTTEVPNGTE